VAGDVFAQESTDFPSTNAAFGLLCEPSCFPFKSTPRGVETFGMGLTFLAGYVLGQHGAQSARLASLAGARSGATVDDILDLEERVDRLILVVDAMWSLMEQHGYTDDQLKQRIAEMDAEDGHLDLRRTRKPTLCGGCGAMVPADLPSCQFCGTVVPDHPDSPFDSV
jgi:hypothetical protein